MKQKYIQPVTEATEHAPQVPDEVSADTSEITEAINIILGADAQEAGKRKARSKPQSLAQRALVFRKRLERIESEMEGNDES